MSLVYLTDSTLGTLDIGPLVQGANLRDCNAAGYVVTDWQVGFPTVREVARPRSLSNGSVDDTRFVGSRVITFNVAIDVNKGDPQETVEALTPYLSPRYRPRLHWTIPGSSQTRSAIVRGADAPLAIAGRQAHILACSWVGVDGVLEGDASKTVVIQPSTDVELGRDYGPPTYPEDQFGPYYTNASGLVERQYPASLGVGDRAIINEGNAVADWVLTMFGSATNPSWTVNGVPIIFNRSGGLTLGAGQSLVIDTRQRTIFLNGDPDEPRYDLVNFTEWAWEDVRLQPGVNQVRFDGDVLGPTAAAQLVWRDTWI